MIDKLDEYDMLHLSEAKEILIKIYEFNYSSCGKTSKRLETIIRKIEELEEINKENKPNKTRKYFTEKRS